MQLHFAKPGIGPIYGQRLKMLALLARFLPFLLPSL
jgi:hypothetical protein